MVSQLIGITMGNRACEWVCARLPLWVSVSDDPTDGNGDRADLSAEDRRLIAGHLEVCRSCRCHRSMLEEALGALAATAALVPELSGAPSLWPELERRIEADRTSVRWRWFRAVHRIAERGLRSWGPLDGERPLCLVWLGDSSRERIERVRPGGLIVGWGLRRQTRSLKPMFVQTAMAGGSRGRWGLVLGLGLAASVLALIAGLSAARRHQAGAELVLRASSTPLAVPVVPHVQPQEEPPADSEPRAYPDGSASALAQAETVRAPEAPVSGREVSPTPRAGVQIRFGYDLEHGIPMPPDARDFTPVY
jgi:hypothetical protein